MDNIKYPKWMELHPFERHQLLGEIIDAMVYHGEAVEAVRIIRDQFRAMGYIKSTILPPNSENDNVLNQ